MVRVTTVVEPAEGGGVKVSSYAVEPATRRWRAIALGLIVALALGAAAGWTVLVLRWDAARTRELAEALAVGAAARQEARCWRELSQRRTRMVSWIQEAQWIKACVEEATHGKGAGDPAGEG